MWKQKIVNKDETVLIEPIVCSTRVAALAYASWPRDAIFDKSSDMTPPDITIRGMDDSMTSVRSHPLINAITNPPTNVDTS